jgi:inner membrane protein involved in colicin E2 resistance
LTEWEIYAAIEPWGEERADLRAGIIASVIANVNRGKGQKAFTPQMFMPYADTGKDSEEEAQEETRKTLQTLQNRFSAMKGPGLT